MQASGRTEKPRRLGPATGFAAWDDGISYAMLRRWINRMGLAHRRSSTATETESGARGLRPADALPEADPSIEHKLRAKLAEYDVLKKEIHNRSNHQHRLLQIHVTALTLIMATALSESVSRWVLLIVPFEAAIFGMWWTDHAIYERRIGWFILNNHERYIDRLLNEPEIISWERRRRDPTDQEFARWSGTFRVMHDWTFRWPSLLVLLATITAAVVTVPGVSNLRYVEGVAAAVNHFLPMSETYDHLRPVVLALASLVGSIVFRSYASLHESYWELGEQQREALDALL